MPLIDFSEEDILRSKIVEPAWYRCKIETVELPAISSKGDSTNYVLKGKILFNADSGDKTFAGVPCPYWGFNSKAKSNMVGLFAAFGAEPKSGSRMELNDVEGKEIDVFIENDLYNGQTVNRIHHKYRAPRS